MSREDHLITLDRLHREQRIARIELAEYEQYENQSKEGLVLDHSERFVVLRNFSDHGHFDGIQILDLNEILDVEEMEHGDFWLKVLNQLDPTGFSPVSLDLGSWCTIIRSHVSANPLVSIATRPDQGNVFRIGLVTACTEERIDLRLIAPGAIWLDDVESFALDDIHEIEFDTHYLKALWIGAGLPDSADL